MSEYEGIPLMNMEGPFINDETVANENKEPSRPNSPVVINGHREHLKRLKEADPAILAAEEMVGDIQEYQELEGLGRAELEAAAALIGMKYGPDAGRHAAEALYGGDDNNHPPSPISSHAVSAPIDIPTNLTVRTDPDALVRVTNPAIINRAAGMINEFERTPTPPPSYTTLDPLADYTSRRPFFIGMSERRCQIWKYCTNTGAWSHLESFPEYMTCQGPYVDDYDTWEETEDLTSTARARALAFRIPWAQIIEWQALEWRARNLICYYDWNYPGDAFDDIDGFVVGSRSPV